MKRNKIIAFLLMAFLIASCSNEQNASSNESIIDDSSSISESGNISSSTSEKQDDDETNNDSSIDDNSKSDEEETDEETTDDDVTDLGKKSIADAKALVSEYIKDSDLNVSKCAVNKQYKVTIEGLAIYKVNLVKSTKNYGLDILPAQKVILADESGYIACSSSALLDKVGNYVGKVSSSYSVTGYLSMYLNHPEINVTDFEWKESLNKTFDAFSKNEGELTIDGFSTKASEIFYNCAGHGFGDIYTIKSVKCIYANKSSNKYVLTDGTRVFKAIANNDKVISLTLNNVYDLAGIVSVQNYEPAFVIVGANSSDSKVTVSLENSATELSINSLRSTLKTSQDDTDKRFPEFIKAHQQVYYANVYVTACVENNKYYVTASDAFCDSKDYISGKKNAMSTYKMVTFENNALWNLSETQLLASYNPLHDYLDKEETVKIYYIPFQLDYEKNEPLWKVLLLPEYLPSLVSGE